MKDKVTESEVKLHAWHNYKTEGEKSLLIRHRMLSVKFAMLTIVLLCLLVYMQIGDYSSAINTIKNYMISDNIIVNGIALVLCLAFIFTMLIAGMGVVGHLRTKGMFATKIQAAVGFAIGVPVFSLGIWLAVGLYILIDVLIPLLLICSIIYISI